MHRFSQKELAVARVQKEVFLEMGANALWPPEAEERLQPLLGPQWFAYLLMGMASRESHFGLLLKDDPETPEDEGGTPGGLGDHGHGHGEMQMDDRYHPDFTESEAWRDLATNIYYAIVKVLHVHYAILARQFELFGEDYLNLILAMVASFNAGVGGVLQAVRNGLHWDARTTGQNYSSDVWNRAEQLIQLV